ncbi:hypothetical protein A2U01_0050169, partial [Trifolium medium]|nr:hypothetical protein [Trifolium medium]
TWPEKGCCQTSQGRLQPRMTGCWGVVIFLEDGCAQIWTFWYVESVFKYCWSVEIRAGTVEEIDNKRPSVSGSMCFRLSASATRLVLPGL